jgi:catechol 2,3-dioxygenase-like lactoylglutathione lyase family enzyme
MISHIFISVSHFQRAFLFYSSIMGELGMQLKFNDPAKPWAGWMAPDAPRPLFVIGIPYNGQAAAPGNGQMIALLAPTRGIVDRVHSAALKRGGTCEGAPGLRPHYHPDYYGAYFRDMDGNKLGVACHSPVEE